MRSGTLAPRGDPVGKSNLIRRSFKRNLKTAEQPDIRFHDLQHTAATLLLSEGVHPRVVQERLGHTSIMLTLDTRSHVLPSMQKKATEKLDRLLRWVLDLWRRCRNRVDLCEPRGHSCSASSIASTWSFSSGKRFSTTAQTVSMRTPKYS